jgi:hypothetical protein
MFGLVCYVRSLLLILFVSVSSFNGTIGVVFNMVTVTVFVARCCLRLGAHPKDQH